MRVRKLNDCLPALVLAAALGLFPSMGLAVEKAFLLGGTNVTLTEVTAEVGVRYGAMRMNPINNRWNLDLCLTNKSYRMMPGPLVVLVESFSGTSGPLQPDAFDGSNPAKAYYDLTPLASVGQLWPGEKSGNRTVQLGYNQGSPNLNCRVFANLAASDPGLALVRTLNDMGQPLPGVSVTETGPAGTVQVETDPVFALATLGRTNGEHFWQFSAPNHLSVWRRETLRPGEVTLLFAPRLTRGSPASAIPLAGGQLVGAGGSVRVQFSPGAFSGNVTGSLTPQTAQTLPMLLPLGWSPLQAWTLDLSAEPTIPAVATAVPWGAISPAEPVALVRWNSTSFQWDALQIVNGQQTNAMTLNLPGSGSFALAVPDSGNFAPPAAQIGQPLRATSVAWPDYATLTATGSVTPAVSLASVVPELVTATAHLTITGLSNALPSGLPLRGEIREDYRLRDGTRRTPPQYENFLVGYQRPGDIAPTTLTASFPMQPLLLFSRDALDLATVTVDVLPPSPFTGRVLDPRGGQVPGQGIVLYAAPGALTNRQAIQIRALEVTNFPSSVGLPVWSAFDLSVSGVAPGHRLSIQVSSLPTNRLFVLAQVRSTSGQFGLEPLERLRSDASGMLTSLEPTSGERLPGLAGAGQYLLLQVSAPQALVTGISRNSAGQAVSGLPVRVTGQPWLTYSKTNGLYRLIAPVGAVEIVTTDPTTGDLGTALLTIANPNVPTSANASAVPTGPRVVGITPTNNAVNVGRSQPIIIRFSEAINPGSLGTNGVRLLLTNGQPVAASLSLNLQSTVLTLIPLSQLSASSLHTVLLFSNITDTTGLPVEGPRQFNFITESDVLNRLVAQVISYEPTNGFAAMYGSPGTAEPNTDVILVNETSGQTATVQSRSDGSFSNSIPAGLDDFLSAVLVNQNGARNTIPVERQFFADGSVGLYQGGGVIEAPGVGGNIQLAIEPGVIQTKSIFKLEAVSTSQLQVMISNTPPVGGRLLMGAKITFRGDPARGDANMSFPFDPAVLNLPPGELPEEGAFALTVITKNHHGQTVYQVVDKLRYANGRLFSNTQPLDGILGFLEVVGAISDLADPFTLGTMVVGAVYMGTRPFVVGGTVYECTSQLGCLGLPFIGSNSRRPLSGAFVALSIAGLDFGQPGELRPGMIYATSGRDGKFAVVLPSGGAAFGNYILNATHPRFTDIAAAPVSPIADFSLVGGVFGSPPVSKDLYFSSPAGLNAPISLSVVHDPYAPESPGNVTLRVDASHPHSGPVITTRLAGILPRSANAIVLPDAVRLMPEMSSSLGNNRNRSTVQVVCETNLELFVSVEITAALGGGVVESVLHEIHFGSQIPPPAINLVPADANDTVGPSVVSTIPGRFGTLWPGAKIILEFNEPINTDILDHPMDIVLVGPRTGSLGRLPSLSLSPNQQTLEILFDDLKPGQDYKLELGNSIKDLAEPTPNPFDQEPRVPLTQTFRFDFRTAAVVATALPDLSNGGGVVVDGNYCYALDRTERAALFVYDVSVPSRPDRRARVELPSYPRDLTLIKGFTYFPRLNQPAVTNDLLVIVGGAVGAWGDELGNVFTSGQYLRVLNVGDPEHPTLLASALITLRPSTVTKVRASPPLLIYLENDADIQQLGLIDLRQFILGFNSPAQDRENFRRISDPPDPEDRPQRPLKNPPEFYGKLGALTIEDTSQRILDFDYQDGYCGVTLSKGRAYDSGGRLTGPEMPPAYRTLQFEGIPVPETVTPPSHPTKSFNIGANPKRLSTFFEMLLPVGDHLEPRVVVAVTLSPDSDNINKLFFLDISSPGNPTQVGIISFPALGSGSALQSVTLRSDGLLAVATTSDLILVEPQKINLPQVANAPHPAVVGVIAGAGSGNITLGGNDAGVQGVNLGGRHLLVQSAPKLSFVYFPNTNGTFIKSADLVDRPQSLEQAWNLLRDATADGLQPSRFKAGDGATSTLTPPSPLTHYYLLMEAPGGAGSQVELGLESLNRAGFPIKNKGRNFATVRALSAVALASLDQTPRIDCDAPIRPLTAYRLSSDKKSPYYNMYLSKPFALTYERIPPSDLHTLTTVIDREIIWSGFYLRGIIDPSMGASGGNPSTPGNSANEVLSPFASTVDAMEKVIRAGSAVIAETFPAGYVMGANPPPVGGHVEVPGTFGTVSAHNGEFRHETIDFVLPSRRMPIVFERTIGGQDLHEGAFGPGWDFNFNEHLTELRPSLVPAGTTIPQVTRADVSSCTAAESRDVLFNGGGGRVICFKYRGENAPPEVSSDPLVNDLGWGGSAKAFYLPESGVGNDGQFARLTPEGTQYWYTKSGRLERIYDRYTNNIHVLHYNARGDLVRIADKSVSTDRFLDIGYYRFPNESDFESMIDERTSRAADVGKICRLKDYTGRDVRFLYNDDGMLERRLGVEVTQASNGGFTGRVVTRYLQDGDCSSPAGSGTTRGVITGNGAEQTGTPLFTADMIDRQDPAKPAVMGGMGAGGHVGVHPPAAAANNAANTDNIITTASGPDGAMTEFKFDKGGYPKEIKFMGQGAREAKHTPKFNDLGLLVSMTYPEGNETGYSYDTNNLVFRSRGNLIGITNNPGPRGGGQLYSLFEYDRKYNFYSGTIRDFNGNLLTYAPETQQGGKDIGEITYPGIGKHHISLFNEYGQLDHEENPDGTTMGYVYDASTGFKKEEIHGNITTTFDYDSSIPGKLGVPTAVDLPEAGADDITDIKYDERLLLTHLKRGLMEEWRSYDTNGNQIYLKRVLDSPVVFYEETRSYDQINFLRGITIKGVDVDGTPTDLATTFTPDAAFRVRTNTYPGGEIRTYDYDHLGNVIKMTLGSGNELYAEKYTRDLHGNLIGVAQGRTADPTEITRSFGYDGHDRLIASTNFTGTGEEITEYSYHGNGERKLTKVTGPLPYGEIMNVEIMAVDALGRPKREVRRGEQISTASRDYDYPADDMGGQTIFAGPRLSFSLTSTHDTAGRARRLQNSTIADVTYTPDDNRNLKEIRSVEEGRTFTTVFTYDGLDHRRTHSDDVGQLFGFTPRVDGQVKESKDGRDKVTKRAFTVLGELTSMTRPNQVVFTNHFNKQRLPTFVGDKSPSPPNGHTFEYDGTFRQKKMTLRDSTRFFEFMAPDGRNLPMLINLPGGGNIACTYDLQGRRLSQDSTYSGQDYKVSGTEYDALGRVRKINYGQAGQFAATYKYDKLGPLTEASFNEAFFQSLGWLRIKHDLYEDGTRKSVTYPGGALVVNEDRHNSGRLETVRTASGNICHITSYDGADIPGEVSLGGGVIIERNTYDLRKRLIARRYERNSDHSILAEVRYKYDAANNRTARQYIHRGGRADFFAYDDGDRLTRADVGARPMVASAAPRVLTGFMAPAGFAPGMYARTYAYDSGGLDLLQGGTPINPDNVPLPPFAAAISDHDDFLQAKMVDGFNRGEADPLGNTVKTMLQVRQSGDSGPTPVGAMLTYNGLSQLVKVERDDGVTIDYKHQPDGLMHHRKVTQEGMPAVTLSDTAFVYDQGRLIEEYEAVPQGQGAPVLRARYFYADDDNPFAADIRDGAATYHRYYYLRDAQGSVMAVADDTGHVVERVNYDPWGQPTIEMVDTAPPAISNVVNTGTAILIHFTESVLPPLGNAAGGGSDLVPTLQLQANAITFTSSGGGPQIGGTLTYVESVPGAAFGSTFRFAPSDNIPAQFDLHLAAGVLADEWGNANAAATIPMFWDATPGAVLFQSQPADSTAPQLLARGTIGSPFLLHGQYFDYDAGLVYLRARFYEPFTGQFLQRDPQPYDDNSNPYAAFKLNPETFRDPTGAATSNPLFSSLKNFLHLRAGVAAKSTGLNVHSVEAVVTKALKQNLTDDARVMLGKRSASLGQAKEIMGMMKRNPGLDYIGHGAGGVVFQFQKRSLAVKVTFQGSIRSTLGGFDEHVQGFQLLNRLGWQRFFGASKAGKFGKFDFGGRPAFLMEHFDDLLDMDSPSGIPRHLDALASAHGDEAMDLLAHTLGVPGEVNAGWSRGSVVLFDPPRVNGNFSDVLDKVKLMEQTSPMLNKWKRFDPFQ